jgi:hypothetical protein
VIISPLVRSGTYENKQPSAQKNQNILLEIKLDAQLKLALSR